jgi:hypothetical protein
MDDSQKDPLSVNTSTPRSLLQDVERTGNYALLSNTTVSSFSWENVNVTVKDRQNGQAKAILTNSSGVVKAGNAPSL